MYGEHCTLAVRRVTEHFELFAFGIGTFHFSEQIEVQTYQCLRGWSVSNCLCKQRVGGQ